MRVCQYLVVAAFALGASIAQAQAQSSDLLGTWTATVTIQLDSEGQIVEVERELSIVIEQVHDQLIRGYHTWKALSDNPGYVGDLPLLDAREPLLGAVTSDGKTIRLVEIEDEGLLFGERLGDDEIEFTYMESAPHAVVYSAIYRRVE